MCGEDAFGTAGAISTRRVDSFPAKLPPCLLTRTILTRAVRDPPRVWASRTEFFEEKGSGFLEPYTKQSKLPVAIAAQDRFGAGVDSDVWTTPSKKALSPRHDSLRHKSIGVENHHNPGISSEKHAPSLVSLASHLSDTDRCETVGDKARILCGEGGRGLCGNSENKS